MKDKEIADLEEKLADCEKRQKELQIFAQNLRLQLARLKQTPLEILVEITSKLT